MLVFLLQVATGAAASANEMHGIRMPTFIHLGSALLSTMFIGATLWARRGDPALSGRVVTAAILLGSQLVLGATLMWLGARPLWLALAHGMVSPMLAIALVSLATASFRANEHGC